MDDERGATECLRCDGSLTSVGVEQFRVGGTSGGWKLVFGDLAELGEGRISFEILACGSCGYVELRKPGFAPVGKRPMEPGVGGSRPSDGARHDLTTGPG